MIPSEWKITLSEWFDAENEDHLRAYQHFYNNGSWPENFVPNNILNNMPNESFKIITNKIVQTHLRMILGKKFIKVQ